MHELLERAKDLGPWGLGREPEWYERHGFNRLRESQQRSELPRQCVAVRLVRRKVHAAKAGRMGSEQQLARHEHAVLPKAVVRLPAIDADGDDDRCVEQEVCRKGALSR